MDFSRSFEPGAILDARRSLDRARFRGHRGGLISTHRALSRLVLDPLDLVVSVTLVFLFSTGWLASLPLVCRFWNLVLATGTRLLALETSVGQTAHQITPYLRFAIPYPRLASLAPSARLWWTTTAVVLLLWGASFLAAQRYLPWAYLLRAVLCVQASALVYFGWSTASFPHSANSYMEGLVGYGIMLISFVPAIFGLTYYIFDFSLIRKILLTLVTMIHLCLFIPLQVLLQAIVLHRSVLFMPLLYMVFGLPVDILIIIAFYSWGMSWPSKRLEPVLPSQAGHAPTERWGRPG